MLRGAGAAVGLPFLEAMLPGTARAQSAVPLRLLAWYFPNGYYRATVGGQPVNDWRPTGEGSGASWNLSPLLQPLAPYKNDLSVLTGLTNKSAEVSSLPCGHARGTGSFLTCVPVNEGATTNGTSMDQVAARELKRFTRYPSLELGTEVDGGQSPFRTAIAWADANTPLAKESRPALLFDRIFSSGDAMLTAEQLARRKLYKKSVLDSVLGSATSLKGQLGHSDNVKLDGYLTAVRELELRVSSSSTLPTQCNPGQRPAATGDIQTQMKQMSDVLALALQCDLTRVATFMFDTASSDLAYPFLTANGGPINSGHHSVSHHHSDPANLAVMREIILWHVQQFAYFLGKLKAIDEGGVSLLSRSAIFMSSEMGDSDLHEHRNLPVIVAGSAGGALTPGRHLVYPNGADKADLFITLLRSVGVNVQKFGYDGDVALTGMS